MTRWQRAWPLLAGLLLAGLAAAPAARVASGVGVPVWLSVVLIVTAALVVMPGAVLFERHKRIASQRHDLGLKIRNGWTGKVSALDDPLQVGVHQAIELPGNDSSVRTPPPYIARDVDEELHKLLSSARFVLIVGDSTAGKSRTAYEAMRTVLKDHTLVSPGSIDEVPAAVEIVVDHKRSLLWLSDLENFMGSGGLTRERILRVINGENHHRVILATLRSSEHDRLTRKLPDDRMRPSREAWEVFDQAKLIRLGRKFSEKELARAQEHRNDVRISAALANSDRYGIPEYLAAGPVLKQVHESGWATGVSPRGAALVEAAIDCRRAGFSDPVPGPLLEELHETYLEARNIPLFRAGTLEKAWEWATAVIEDTTALLSPTSNGSGVMVFDYLVDSRQRASHPTDVVADTVIKQAARFADAARLESLAESAVRQGRFHLAEDLWRQLVSMCDAAHGSEGLSTLAAHLSLARLRCELGRPKEAEDELVDALAILKRAHGHSHPLTIRAHAELGHFLFIQARLQEAEEELRTALQAWGDLPNSDERIAFQWRNDLGSTLWAQRRLEEAETEHQAVRTAQSRILGEEDSETLLTGMNIGSVLWAQSRLNEAEQINRQVLEVAERTLGSDHPDTLTMRNNQATVYWHLGRLEEAESELRAVIEARGRVQLEQHAYTHRSRDNLAKVLRDQGRLTEAASEFREVIRARELIHGPSHADTLESRQRQALVLAALGQMDEALAEQRIVVERRHQAQPPRLDAKTLIGRSNLAMLLREAGQDVDAEAERRPLLALWTELNGDIRPFEPWYLGRFDAPDAELRVLRELAQGKKLGFPVYDLYARANFVGVLHDVREYPQALQELRWLTHWQMATLGEGHPETRKSLERRRQLELLLR